MKIVSSFSDYYDSVMAYGYDSSTTFVRKMETFDITKDPPEVILQLNAALMFKGKEYSYRNKIYYSNDWFIQKKPYYSSLRYISIKIENDKIIKHYFEFKDFQIVFAGEGYRGIKVTHSQDFKLEKQYYYFYDLVSFTQFINEYNINLKINDTNHQLEPFFGSIKLNKDLLIEHKISIASRYNGVIEINDRLQNFAFYKVMDSFTAFQKLDAWVSGVLAYPPNFMIEVEDKYKITNHGFDPKYGFRTRPTKRIKQ